MFVLEIFILLEEQKLKNLHINSLHEILIFDE